VADPDDPSEGYSNFSNSTLGTQQTLPVSLNDSIVVPYDPTLSSTWVDNEQLVNTYYLNFHAAHPILVSKGLYWKRDYARCLKAVVEFIGSHFSPGTSTDALRDVVTREIDGGQQDTAEMVQARLLYTVALFARNEVDEGRRMLSRAIDIAIDLKMYTKDFAALHAKNSTAEEESMRRTWYELYVVDGCIAAFQRKSSFRRNSISADVLLPCDPDDTTPCIPVSKSEFDSSVFSDQPPIFSSFTYRIEAVRLLGRVLLITSAHGVHRDRVQAVDNALAAFTHHLPLSKSEPEIVNTYGEIDELMFQAHLIIQYATILLHFPRSDLTSPAYFSNVVPGSNQARIVCPCNRQRIHSIKAVEASKVISMLAALRSPVQGRSPFFVWALALGATVQLAISAVHSKAERHCLEEHCDRVKLMLGVLKSLGRYWFFAKVVLKALNMMALPVFESLKLGGLDDDVASAGNVGVAVCSYATPMSASQWPEALDFQGIQELIGFSGEDFCI
jgi:hypothetical protein